VAEEAEARDAGARLVADADRAARVRILAVEDQRRGRRVAAVVRAAPEQRAVVRGRHVQRHAAAEVEARELEDEARRGAPRVEHPLAARVRPRSLARRRPVGEEERRRPQHAPRRRAVRRAEEVGLVSPDDAVGLVGLAAAVLGHVAEVGRVETHAGGPGGPGPQAERHRGPRAREPRVRRIPVAEDAQQRVEDRGPVVHRHVVDPAAARQVEVRERERHAARAVDVDDPAVVEARRERAVVRRRADRRRRGRD